MTETFIQGWIQALGGSGYAVAFVLTMATVAALAAAGIAGCIFELWQGRRRKASRHQRQLERSESRARSESWSAKR